MDLEFRAHIKDQTSLKVKVIVERPRSRRSKMSKFHFSAYLQKVVLGQGHEGQRSQRSKVVGQGHRVKIKVVWEVLYPIAGGATRGRFH